MSGKYNLEKPIASYMGRWDICIYLGSRYVTVNGFNQTITISLIFAAQVQEAGVQDAASGRKAAEGDAHAHEFAKVVGVRGEQPSREDRQDVQQRPGSELPLPGDWRYDLLSVSFSASLFVQAHPEKLYMIRCRYRDSADLGHDPQETVEGDNSAGERRSLAGLSNERGVDRDASGRREKQFRSGEDAARARRQSKLQRHQGADAALL